MTAEAERRAMAASVSARHARSLLQRAQARERSEVVHYVDEALSAGWQWDRIGSELGITGTGVRRYYERNKRRAHGGDV